MEVSAWKVQVYKRILNDEAQISQALFDGKPLGTILSLRGVDKREDEFRPCFVECEAGRFLYKPRDLRFEDAFGALALSLFKDEVRSPRYLVCDGYGYAEYVQLESMPVMTEEPDLLSYRMGKVHSLFHALGFLDTNRENISVRDNVPVLVDVEVCLEPKQYPMDVVQQRLETEAQHNETLRELLDSPFRGGAGLFAFAQVPKSGILGLLPCKGVGGAWVEGDEIKGDGIKGDGTEGDGAKGAGNSPALPAGFTSYVQGYLEGWGICLEHRSLLEDFVKACEDYLVRVVLPCGSPLHNSLKQQLAHSQEWVTKTDFSFELGEAVLEEIRGDIALQAKQRRGPIYRAKVGEKTLYDVRAGKEYPNFFAASALDNTLAHLARAHANQAQIITTLFRDLLLDTASLS